MQCGDDDGVLWGMWCVAEEGGPSEMGLAGEGEGEGGCRENQWTPSLALGIRKGTPDSVSSRQPKTTARKETCCGCAEDWKGNADTSVFQ